MAARPPNAYPDAMKALLDEIARAGIVARPPGSDGVERIPQAKGAYLLAIRLDHPVDVRVSTPHEARLQPGWYVYCGSANGPGGLRARLRRHLRADKKPHWHVDRLTCAAAKIVALPVCDGEECELVASPVQRSAFAIAAEGFGSTDCTRCRSHLLRFGG